MKNPKEKFQKYDYDKIKFKQEKEVIDTITQEVKKKDNDWEIFELDEFLIYKNHNYFIKRFDANKFCKLNDFIKIKGVLYETSFM